MFLCQTTNILSFEEEHTLTKVIFPSIFFDILPITMISTDKSRYFYNFALEIVQDNALTYDQKVLFLDSILNELLQELTRENSQLFTDSYSRMMFVFSTHHTPQNIEEELIAFRTKSKIARQKSKSISENDVAGCLRALCLAVFFFSNEPTPPELLEIYRNITPLNSHKRSFREKDVIPFFRAILLSFNEAKVTPNGRHYRDASLSTDELGTITLRLWDKWSEINELTWDFATLNCTEIQKLSDEKQLFSTTKESFIVLEPDFLVDATDIAECFQFNGSNPLLFVLKNFIRSKASEQMILGNIVNYLLDELLLDSACDFDEIFPKTFLQKPLSLLPLLQKKPNLVEQLRSEAHVHFLNIQAAISTLKFDSASVEPTFISSLYGLQGRLDVMTEFADDPTRKDVIELKSGKAPDSGFWKNHLAQVTCYNLLLDSAFENRIGASCILYSKTQMKPLRNAPNVPELKQQLIQLRNEIVAIQYQLSQRKFASLRSITLKDFGEAPDFKRNDIERFQSAFNNSSNLESKYFRLFVSFLMRELWSGKVGSGEYGTGFSSLWRRTIEEKESDFSVLSHLRLNFDESDFDKFYLTFDRTDKTPSISTFRRGDIVLLYPIESNETAKPLQRQILKGNIKEITPEKIIVSLRNKQLHSSIFEQFDFWTIEADFISTEFSSKCASLLDFLSSPKHKRDILLGLIEPEFSETKLRLPENISENLTAEQLHRLNQALSAQDYFLLQGPPGTGKTSRMLKSIVHAITETSDEHIVVAAFTNRAVDEICDALLSISQDFPFIRLGSKDTTQHANKTLYTLSLGKSPEKLAEMIRECRVVVSTISSLASNDDLFVLKQFQTIIVDEASQITEPQLVGLLTRFDRFILIGDEQQLPAVVTQSELGLRVNDETLNSIGIVDLRMSLFERLLLQCTKNGWKNTFGMISAQGRMHKDIQEFPNHAFYNGNLQTIADWQDLNNSDFLTYYEQWKTSEKFIENLDQNSNYLRQFSEFLHKRVLFFPSAPENHTKHHNQEAKRVAEVVSFIAEIYGDNFTKETVGIITPYRAQIAAILAELPKNLHPKVTVDTVERFQGSEREIIILSFAVNNSSQLTNLQSLTFDGKTDRKLNVALTRARHHLFAFGCAEILSERSHFRNFIDHVKIQGGFL